MQAHEYLNHGGLVMPYGIAITLPDGTKPIPEPILTSV